MEYPKRKSIRLKQFDYSSPGIYFVTICTKNKQKILCHITAPDVGTVVLDGPCVQLTEYGEIVERRLSVMCDFYEEIKIDSYVIMPNHIHLLIRIMDSEDGPSGTTVPTNAKVGRFVGTLKRFCNREIGHNIWQSRFHDHIVREERDYSKIAEYIASNPTRWLEDKYYIAD